MREMTNSPLVCYTKLSPNHSGLRTHGIDRITPHCVVGQLSCESICDCFPKERIASCNYGIGSDGRVSLCVEEKNRSWCSSSNANDQRAVTIECASDRTAPYAMNENVLKSLVELCVDICKRNGKTKLLWIGDKDKTLSYEPKPNEMVITVHRWFSNTACPGGFLMSKMAWIAEEVNERLKGSERVKIRYKGKELEVDGKNEDGTVYVKARELLQKMGFSVSWDNESKTVVVS